MSKKKKSVFGFDAIQKGTEQEIAVTTQITEETETQKKKGSDNGKSKPIKRKGEGKQQTETESDDGTVKGNSEAEPITGEEKGFMEQFIEEKRRPKIEDTHKRDTFLIEKDLLRRLKRLAKKQPKGFQTRLVNYALRKALDEVEGKN